MTYSNQNVSDADRGCGARLRKAREAAGLRVEDVAARLKMPARVVESLENEDWDRLGAPVFVRGQLRSYSRLLGLATTTTLEASGLAPIEPPKLVSHSHTPRVQRLMEAGTRRLIYIVLTAVIAVPVWLATKPHLNTTAATPDVQPLDAPIAVGTNAAPGGDAPAKAIDNPPVVASLAPTMSPRPSAVPAIALHFNGDSWVQVIAPGGRTLEQGLLPAGTTRSYAAGEVGRVVLGNADAVSVERAGQALDLGPFRRANVARFTVSSDGSLAPVAN
ncbi:MAG TPA: RodZ domain-containing protein [Lysobacter sp.]|nr:RodZ domain-containing protein [Lysobacter sp.]